MLAANPLTMHIGHNLSTYKIESGDRNQMGERRAYDPGEVQTMEPRRLNLPPEMSTGMAALGGLLPGFDTAVFTVKTEALPRTFHVTPCLLGVPVSCAICGTVLTAAKGQRAPSIFLAEYRRPLLIALRNPR